MTARIIRRFLAPIFRGLFKDRRGDLQTHLLLTAAGCTMVGLAAPSLYNSSQKCSNTFDKQVSVLENGASPGGGAGGIGGIAGQISSFASTIGGIANQVSGTVSAVQGTVAAAKSGNVAGVANGVAGAANAVGGLSSLATTWGTNGTSQTSAAPVSVTSGGQQMTVSAADGTRRAEVLRGLATSN